MLTQLATSALFGVEQMLMGDLNGDCAGPQIANGPLAPMVNAYGPFSGVGNARASAPKNRTVDLYPQTTPSAKAFLLSTGKKGTAHETDV